MFPAKRKKLTLNNKHEKETVSVCEHDLWQQRKHYGRYVHNYNVWNGLFGGKRRKKYSTVIKRL